jgi:hypothetical protein
METKSLGTDEEIKEFIAKNYGSYDCYRKAQFEQRPSPTAEPREKSKSEELLDCFNLIAKSHGVSLDKLFAQRPELYEKWRQASYAKGSSLYPAGISTCPASSLMSSATRNWPRVDFRSVPLAAP